MSPYSLLALLREDTTDRDVPIRMPSGGVPFDTAMRLGATYCFILSHMTTAPRVELVNTIEVYMKHLGGNFAGRLGRSVRDLWDASSDSKVAFTYEFLNTLTRFTEAFLQLGSASHPMITVYHRSRSESKGYCAIAILQTTYADQRAPIFTVPNQEITLCDALRSIQNDSITLMNSGPPLTSVPPSLYVPAPRPDPASNDKGKQKREKSAKTPKNKTKNQESFVVELLESAKPNESFKVRQIFRATRPTKPQVMVNGTRTDVCFRACGSFLGGCQEGSACSNFHFPQDGSKPPSTVDLTDFKRYLADERVATFVKPSDLGTAVWGSL